MHNYGINAVSKLVNIASKRVSIARVNVSSRKYRIMQKASYESARGSRRAKMLVFFIAKIALNFSAR